MRVLFFTKYTRQGASSRVRTFQYLDYFKKNGVDCTVSPFFSDKYLLGVYKYKKHNKWQYIRSFVHRFFMLFTVVKYDFVVIEKELFPYFPAIFERLLMLFGIRFLVDYDDAIWHNYDAAEKKLIRDFLGRKIARVMHASAVVTAGNEYIASYARAAGARRVEYVPTVIDLTRYTSKAYCASDVFVIGWIGSPITHKYLAALKPVFTRLSAEHNIKLKLIGSNLGIGLPEIEELVPWTEEGEIEAIKSFNVGIMPLADNIWERGKCGYKLIQYMGCGVPVVGTPLGVNARIILDGINGYKADALDEWYLRLKAMILQGIELEEKMGLAARRFAEAEYSMLEYEKKYLNLLVTTAGV